NNTGTLIVPALSNAIGFNLSELSGTSSNRLTNSGHITAHNGFVTLSSDALDIITGSAINNSGIIDISIQPGNTSGGVVEINASQGTLIQNGNILATGGDISLQSDNIRITSPVELIADKVLFKKSTAASGGILNLRADAHITADSTIDLSEFSIIGAGDGVSLTLETNANESTIQLNTIQNVGELTATAEGTLILAGDIQAAGDKLTLNAGAIQLDSNISIRNTLPGNLILTGPITGQNNSLTLRNLQGKVSVDGINGVTNLTILNNLGTTEVNGDLSLTGAFNAVQSGSLTLNGNRAISANSILLDGITTQSNGTLKLTASTSGNISGGNISIGQITASEFSASGGTLILNGGITTGIGNKLDLSGMTSIELTGNSVLTGNLNLYLTDKDHTTGIYNTEGTTAYQLSIVSGSD